MTGTEQITQTALPPIEGASPSIFWYTIIGLIALASLYLLYDKVRKSYMERKKEKQDELAEHDGTIQGQLDKMNRQITEIQADLKRQFAEYDKKFAADKETLDMHTRQINEQQTQIGRLYGGQKAQCRGIIALLNHEITGNSVDKLKTAKEKMEDYLLDGVWPEDNEGGENK